MLSPTLPSLKAIGWGLEWWNSGQVMGQGKAVYPPLASGLDLPPPQCGVHHRDQLQGQGQRGSDLAQAVLVRVAGSLRQEEGPLRHSPGMWLLRAEFT